MENIEENLNTLDLEAINFFISTLILGALKFYAGYNYHDTWDNIIN